MGYELQDDGYEPPVRVHCPCGREMRRHYSWGKNWFRCGCGAGVQVDVPDPRVKQDQCGVWRSGVRCATPISRGDLACSRCLKEIFWEGMKDGKTRRSVALALSWEEIHKAKVDARWEEVQEQRKALEAKESEREERRRQQEAQAVHVVYYVRLGVNHIKIGTTGRLSDRMAELRVVNPDNLLAIEPGSYDVEKKRHKQFSAHQYERRKEDFVEAPELLELVKRLRAQWGDPHAYVASQLAQRKGGGLLSA